MPWLPARGSVDDAPGPSPRRLVPRRADADRTPGAHTPGDRVVSRVAVLGAGGIGCGAVALLSERAHTPVLWSPSGRGTAAFADRQALQAEGMLTGQYHPVIAADCAAALHGADAVMLAVPGYGHRAVLDQVAAHLRSGQPMIISSHMSLSALYLAQRLAARGVRAPIAAWGTTITTGRRLPGGAVRVSNIREKVDIAALPRADIDALTALCTELFGDRFVPRDDLIAVSLSNVNPQNHLGIALCNFTRIENAEPWANWSGLTPSVGRLIEALDAERLAVAAAYGAKVRTVRDHFHLSFGVPHGPVGDAGAILAARDPNPGPASMETRYITEDVPFGLVPSTVLARIAGVAMPLHEAGIAMFSALYGRDFRAENDLLPELGLDGLSVDALRRQVRG
jgi:opine dehydrogenase